MNKLIFDAGPLIAACKFSAASRLIVDHLLDYCAITVAASVYDEVVVAGASYPDAQAARQRIDQGRIAVLLPPPDPALETLLVPYGLGDGERDSILLTGHANVRGATLVIDDQLAYLVSDRLGLRKRFLLDIIADLARAGMLDKRLAMSIVQAVRTRYPPAFVEHTLLLLQR
jgi:predicted nucleic acid-binding protein